MILGTDQAIGDVIVQLRINRGMTRADLARAADVHLRTLGRIENKEHFAPDWALIRRILEKGLGIRISFTYRKADDEDPVDVA